jgi:hypothetical protein
MDRARCFDTPVKRPGVAWTLDDVSARFFEAAITARRLPPVRVQGYFNTWPAFARSEWEAYCADEPVRRSFPPSPEEVDRMLETMKWVLWLDVDARHLVWMRAKGYGWKEICTRFCFDRTTGWRHWQCAMQVIVDRLNKVLSRVE